VIYNRAVNPIAAKRRELGLSQVQLAYLLGTKQSNISAYERGVLESGSMVEQRFAALLRLGSDSEYSQSSYPTLASQVIELRELLTMPRVTTEDNQDSLILRVIIDTHDQFARLRSPSDQEFFLMQPGRVGLHRADVAFAGMAVHWARQAGLPRVPRWTRNPELYLKKVWYMDGGGEGTAVGCMSIARGVPALRARGIFLMASNVESI